MSHSHFFKHLCKDDIFYIVIASIGIGIVLAIVLPFWWWIIIVGAGLIIYAAGQHFF